jgi:hypothetical protein
VGLPELGDRGPEHGHLIPISVFGKWPPLFDFDFTGSDGRPASLYVRDTNMALDLGLVLGLVATMGVNLSLDLIEVLALMIASHAPPSGALEYVVRGLRSELADRLASSDQGIARTAAETVDLAARLGNSSILWILDKGHPGTDSIVKFSYLDTFSRPPLWKRLLIACSWWERSIGLPLPHAGLHTRYHLEIATPSGLELTLARTYAYAGELKGSRRGQVVPFSGAAVDATPGTQRPDSTAESLDILASADFTAKAPGRDEATEHARIADRRAHIYHAVRAAPSHRMFLKLRLAAPRNGFIAACLTASVIVAALMSFAFARLPEAAEHIDSTVVLLGAVPVVLGYVLLRPTAHALERYHLAGVRFMMLLSGATPILAALALVLNGVPGKVDALNLDAARPVWAALVVLSWLCVTGLGMSWVLAAPARADGRARRWHDVLFRSGLLFAAGVVIGTMIACQPYSQAEPGELQHYLANNRVLVVSGLVLLGLSAWCLYPLVGSTWRVLAARSARFKAPSGRPDDQMAARSRRRRWRFAVLASGLLWIWGTLAAVLLTIGQALAVSKMSHPHEVTSFGRVVDGAANATLVPAAAFVVATCVLAAARRDIVKDSVRMALLAAGLLCTLTIAARGISVVFPAAVRTPPEIGWIALAAWVGVLAVALRTPSTEASAV